MVKSFNQQLAEICRKKNNYLCIGLDIDPDRFPEARDKNLYGMESLAIEVIEATADICPVYKLNLAFYERFGSEGYELLERIVMVIDNRALVIADAKRGDIGNTSRQYAKAIFDRVGFDAVTVSPYMGRDSITPFISDPAKGVFVLGLTSNPGSADLQKLPIGDRKLYEMTAEMVMDLNAADNLGLVVGATNPEEMASLRKLTPGLAWLIPGIGAQGGDLESSIRTGNTGGTGIVNVSRGILYAGDGSEEAIRKAALDYTKQIQELI